MPDFIERGSLLYDSRRFKLAEDEFRRALTEHPNDAYAHGMLALTLVAQDRFDDAHKEAKECVLLEPDNSWNHYAMAFVLYQHNRYKEATAAIEEALRLNPYNTTYFGMAAEIHLMRDEWNKALGMAQLGLELTPTHVDCLNAQAMALTKLGRIKEAEESVELALSEEPENHVSHANRASILFRKGKPNEAAEHYREALRLNPNSKWAREGILEALKSRNPIYYPFAFISAKLSDMDRRTSVAFALLLLFVPPLRALMFLFLILSLTAKKCFNLVLLTDSFGKRILTTDEKNSTTCFGVWLLCLSASIAALVLTHQSATAPVVISLQFLFLLPLMKIFDVEKGMRRNILSVLTAATAVFGIYVIVSSISEGRGYPDFSELQKSLLGVFILACLLSIFYPHGKSESD